MTAAPPFSAVLLAAGSSARMQGEFKQLLPLPTADGERPVVRVTAEALLAARPEEVVVVTGHRGREVASALADLPLTFCPNPRHADGQMTSVACGLAALSRPCTAVMICLADLALIGPDDYRALASAFGALPRDAILIPYHRGRRGNPVVFAASRVPEVLAGQINPGCRRLVEEHAADVVRQEFGHDRFCSDLDTPEDYALIRERMAAAVAPVSA